MATPVTINAVVHGVGATFTPQDNKVQVGPNIQFNDATQLSTTSSAYTADITTYVQNQIYPVVESQWNNGATVVDVKVEIGVDIDKVDGTLSKEHYRIQASTSKITQPADLITPIQNAIARALSIDTQTTTGSGY